MMKQILISFCTAMGLLFSLAPAQATVIDFTEVTASYSGNSLDSKGFNFFNDCANVSTCILHRGPTSPYNADPGGVTFAHNEAHSTTTLTQINGNAFDLISIDFADFFNFLTSQTIQVTGLYEVGGTVVKLVNLSSIIGLETFNFNWQGITQASWREISGNWLQFDNVVVQSALAIPPVVPVSSPTVVPVSSPPPAVQVSSPGTMTLFGFGFTLFLTARKKRHGRWFF